MTHRSFNWRSTFTDATDGLLLIATSRVMDPPLMVYRHGFEHPPKGLWRSWPPSRRTEKYTRAMVFDPLAFFLEGMVRGYQSSQCAISTAKITRLKASWLQIARAVTRDVFERLIICRWIFHFPIRFPESMQPSTRGCCNETIVTGFG